MWTSAGSSHAKWAIPLAATGVALVLCGVAFKIGAVPFQIWVPDVYQGAPTPTTAFLAVGSKAAGFLVLLNLVTGPFSAPWLTHQVLVPLLSTLAALSILFGNLAALGQRNVKRVMGLSGIAHAGYMLVGVVAAAEGVSWAAGAVLFYLFTYLLGSMAVFGVMVHVAGPEDESQQLEHYADLGKRQPFLGGVLAIGLGFARGDSTPRRLYWQTADFLRRVPGQPVFPAARLHHRRNHLHLLLLWVDARSPFPPARRPRRRTFRGRGAPPRPHALGPLRAAVCSPPPRFLSACTRDFFPNR